MKYSNKLGNSPNMASAITAHLCTTVPHAGGKILIATKDLKENTPVIELRGKYMLSNQHRPQLQNSARAGSQKPGPFVFFYRLPKDNTQICIDTRTYGNEARFVRRSCKPNAELQHCIVKGTLHVYLVTTNDIPSNTEITVGHDTNGSKQPCACGNPKHCKVNGLSSLVSRKNIDYPQREKRSRNRCFSSSSSPMSPPLAQMATTPIREQSPPFSVIKMGKKSPIKHEYPPMSPVKEIREPVLSLDFHSPVKHESNNDFKEEEIDLTAKEEMKPDIDEPDFVKLEPPIDDTMDIMQKIEKMEKMEEPEVPLEPEPEVETPGIKPEDLNIKEELATPIYSEDLEPERIEEVEKIAKVEKIANGEKIDKVEKIAKVDKIEKFEKIERLEKAETIERVEKIENVEKMDNIAKIEKEEKIEEKVEPKVEQERPVTRELTAKSACHDRPARCSRADDRADDSQDAVRKPNKEKDKRKMVSCPAVRLHA